MGVGCLFFDPRTLNYTFKSVKKRILLGKVKVEERYNNNRNVCRCKKVIGKVFLLRGILLWRQLPTLEIQ